MNRRLCLSVLVAISGIGLHSSAQAQGTVPTTYDVSTVKPAANGETGMMLNFGDAKLEAKNVTLAWILQAAFNARKDQISGTPAWASEQHYDINAKLVDTDEAMLKKLTPEQRRSLLLALMVERLGLKYHVETKDMATYDLLPSRKGLKLTPAVSSGDTSKEVNGMCSGCSYWGGNSVKAHDVTVAHVADLLAAQLERTVTDRSGYTGNVDVNLRWASDLGTTPPPDEDASLPPLPQALEEQLGLHLQPSHGPVKMYVVDHLDKPSEN